MEAEEVAAGSVVVDLGKEGVFGVPVLPLGWGPPELLFPPYEQFPLDWNLKSF